jgi:type I restriction enzyme S subunit
MSEWKEYNMSELIDEIAMGPFGSNIKVDCFVKKGVPVLNGSNLTGFKLREKSFNYVTKEKAESLGRSNAKRGDIIVTHRGTLGQVSYIPDDSSYDSYVISQSQFRFSCKKDLVFVPYLVYYFHSREGQYKLLSNACQVGVPALARPTSTFKEISVILPPIEEQKRIAGVLSSLDDKIDLLNRENATLEALAETLFRYYFIENPDPTWKEGKLGELINISSGKALKRDEFVTNGLYPILGANGEIGRTHKYNVEEKDRVLYTGRVGTLGNVFRLDHEQVWLSDNTIVVMPKRYYNYVYFILKYANLQDYNVGSTQPLIRQSDIVDIDIVIPDNDLLNSYENEVFLYFDKIKSNQQQILTLTAYRDILLPRLMSGEVKVDE